MAAIGTWFGHWFWSWAGRGEISVPQAGEGEGDSPYPGLSTPGILIPQVVSGPGRCPGIYDP